MSVCEGEINKNQNRTPLISDLLPSLFLLLFWLISVFYFMQFHPRSTRIFFIFKSPSFMAQTLSTILLPTLHAIALRSKNEVKLEIDMWECLRKIYSRMYIARHSRKNSWVDYFIHGWLSSGSIIIIFTRNNEIVTIVYDLRSLFIA